VSPIGRELGQDLLRTSVSNDAKRKTKNVDTTSTKMPSSPLAVASIEQKATENVDTFTECSETSETSSSSSEQSDEHGSQILAWKMQELLERIMTDFYSHFPSWQIQCAGGQVNCANGSNSGQAYSHTHLTRESASDSQATHTVVGETSLKRAMNDRAEDGEDDEDDHPKRSKRLPVTRSDNIYTPKFACPFFKFDPKTFAKYGSCTGPGFRSVSRVKYVSLHILNILGTHEC
jgi:hypothetical protein